MFQLHPTVQGRSDEDHSVVFCLGPSSLFALDTSSLRNMLNLGTKHPQLAEEFENGKFVVNKSSRGFSRIAIDRTHEQNNKCAKGDGGEIGLTENTSELRRWTVAGPEISRLIAEFEAAMEEDNAKAPDLRHHEQVKSIQSTFEKQVMDLSHRCRNNG